MKLKLGKVGGVERRVGERGAGRRPSSSPWVMTPHFFLHNFWHLPACNAGSLSILEKRRGITHSSSCLENTGREAAEKGGSRGPGSRSLVKECLTAHS